MARTVQIILDALTGRAQKNVKDLDESVDDLKRGTDQSGEKFDEAGEKADNFGRAVDVAVGAVAAVAVSKLVSELGRVGQQIAEVGMAFETQLADLEAITGIAGAELQELGDTAVQEAARTGVAAQQQVEAYKLLASNIDIATMGGIDGLKAMGREVVTLSQAAGVDLAQAANISASALNQWSLEAEESTRVINALAAGSKEGAAEVPDLGQALINVGASAAAANVDIEETIGALEILAENGQKGARAGTQVRNMMTILRSESEKLAEHGINNVNVEADGFAGTLEKLEPLLDDAAAMAAIFGRENINAAETLISNAEAVDQMTASVRDTNTAQEQAAIQIGTTQGAMNQLRETVRGMALQVWGEYKDNAKEAIEGVTQALREHAFQIETIIEKSGELATKTANLVEQLGGLQEVLRFLTGFSVDEELRELEGWIDGLTRLADAASSVHDFFNPAQTNSSPTQAGEGATWMREASNEAMDLEENLNAVNSAFQLPGLQQADEALDGAGDSAEESGEQAGDAVDKWAGLIEILDGLQGARWQQELFLIQNGILGVADALDQVDSADFIDAGDLSLPSLQQQFESTGDSIRVTSDQLEQLPEEYRNTEVTVDDLLAVLEGMEGAQEDANAGFENMTEQLTQVAATAAVTSDNAAEAVVNSVKRILAAKLAQLIASNIAILGPAAPVLGPAVAAGMGMLFNQLVPEGFAHGGPVRGPGGPRDDRIPAMLSNGEFVVNARSAEQAPTAVQAMNDSPAMASRIEQMVSAPGGGVGNSEVVNAIREQTVRLEELERVVDVKQSAEIQQLNKKAEVKAGRDA